MVFSWFLMYYIFYSSCNSLLTFNLRFQQVGNMFKNREMQGFNMFSMLEIVTSFCSIINPLRQFHTSNLKAPKILCHKSILSAALGGIKIYCQ